MSSIFRKIFAACFSGGFRPCGEDMVLVSFLYENGGMLMEKWLRDRLESLLEKEYCCGREALNGNGMVYSIRTDKKPYLKILAYRDCVAVCTSPELREKTQALLQGKSRDEIFEMPFVYGQTIHFAPDGKYSQSWGKPGYEAKLLFGRDMRRIEGLTGFENAVAFDEGITPAKAACIAMKDGEIVGAAGAAGTAAEGVWEIGVDVREGNRNEGLATALVKRLTAELLVRKIAPFYSASVTNIGSQMVASRCGYIPLWVDTFGTTLDGSSAYDEIIGSLRL